MKNLLLRMQKGVYFSMDSTNGSGLVTKKKQKYLIEYPESVLFGLAGLYDQWIDKKTVK